MASNANINTHYILGQRFGNDESLQLEFKEFCLKNNIYDYYDPQDVEQMINSGRLNRGFNRVVYDNIRRYFLYYVPKYASAFSNCNIDEGLLYIGINDFGEITGIPFVGDIDHQKIAHYLEDSFQYIRGSTNDIQDEKEYLSRITYEISKLEVDTEYLDDVTEDIADKYNAIKKEYVLNYKKYLDDRDKWIITLRRYMCKLDDVINNNRDDLIYYINKNLQVVFYNDPRNLQIAQKQVLERLYDKRPIIISSREDDIERHKDNPHHYIYWLLKYKDEYVEKYLRVKPRPPTIPKMFNAPFSIITQLSDMRYKIVENTKNINYYLLKVKFPGNIDFNNKRNKKVATFGGPSHSHNYLEYRTLHKQKWQKRARIVGPKGPCCI